MSDGCQEGVTLQLPSHGESMEPCGHKCPHASGPGHPSPRPAAGRQPAAALHSAGPTTHPEERAQRPGSWHSDPGCAQPGGAEAWCPAAESCVARTSPPPTAMGLGSLRCLLGCTATAGPGHREEDSFLACCLPALGLPQRTPVLLGHGLLESTSVAAESPAGRAPTPRPPRQGRGWNPSGTALPQQAPAQLGVTCPTARGSPAETGRRLLLLQGIPLLRKLCMLALSFN